MKKPLVSVIMNCFNGEKFLAEAIESVLNQTYKNFEIIFWDNISTDTSKSIVKSFKDERIKYFLADKHVPLGEARNLAIKKAQAEYIAFLDVDDIWSCQKLEQQIEYFDDPTIGLVYCNVNYINSKGDVINPLREDVDSSYSKVRFVDLLRNYDVTLSSAMVSKTSLNSANGLFDNILVYAEEYDLFMRISSEYDAIQVGNTLASYRIHEKQGTLKLFERGIFEMEYITSKLLLMNEKIFNENPGLLNLKYKKIAWDKFLNEILKGHSKFARKKLWPFLFKDFKYLTFYFLSFFGSNFIRSIWDNHRRKKGKLSFSS